ncbi:hypothetical protein [Spongiactinospora sp. 9N601]|uniref:hypothetical protein n=1 Tax=Spongiactinospora sp. 9N601 TaxID=3375149 RepID=UPI003791110F
MNLADRRLPELVEGFGEILAGCGELLRAGGIVAVTVRPIRVDGGLVLAYRVVALPCGGA